MLKAGIVFDEKNETETLNEGETISSPEPPSDPYLEKSTEELQDLLDQALADENYESASHIRDVLNQRKKS